MKTNKYIILVYIFLILTLILSLKLITDLSFADDTDDIEIYYNQEIINFDVKAVIIEGRTLVPLRKIFETIGLGVEWDDSEKRITASNSDFIVILYIGSDKAYVNGEEFTIDVEPLIIEGRTLVPVRFISEATGLEVLWDNETRTIDIKSKYGSNEAENYILNYKIVDTGVKTFYSDVDMITGATDKASFPGQDADYILNEPSYTDNGNGTITDNVTGLMWEKTMDSKMTLEEAQVYASESTLGNNDDWRLPSIKELFSLIKFTGESGGEVASILYIDTDYFDQPIGDTSLGEREIDAQTWSSTKYVGTTMNNDETIFGVNFVDGRIKGYPVRNKRENTENEMYFRLVRGNKEYGINNFVDNKGGTVTDLATGLMWQIKDDGLARDWEEALKYSDNLKLASHDDWRLPNVKELQSVVDYTKSMQTTGTAAINEMFELTAITDLAGNENYGYYWTSTTHRDGMNKNDSASYVAFGEAQGQMNGQLLDVHGAGSVRSDPKSGSKSDYPDYFGPQGDVRYLYNFILSVRDVE